MKTKINKSILVLNYLNIFCGLFYIKEIAFLMLISSTRLFFYYHEIVYKTVM